MKREVIQLAAAMILVLVAIVMFAILFRVLGLASDEPPEMKLPAPEWEEAGVLEVVDDVAPELENLAVPTAPTFDDVLIEKIAAVDSELAEVAGRLIWGEGGAITNTANRYASLWTAINRAEAWGGTLYERMTEESQFHGLDMTGEVPEQYIREAGLIIALWEMEREGWTIPDNRFPAGLPERFLYFEGDGTVNHFSTDFGGGEYWDGVESRWDV